MVVAVPLAAIVERDDERVRAGEGIERIRGAARREHRVAQGRRQPVEDRRREQEPLELLRLVVQHLLHEVVGDLLADRRSAGPPARRHRHVHAATASPARPPAGQPSVRSCSAPAASADSSSPPLAATSRVSRASSASAAVPISNRSPPARRRASGTPRIAPRDQHQLRPGADLLGQKRENRTALLGR